MTFHHIGIATKNIDEGYQYIKNNFKIVEETEVIYDPKQDAYLKLIKTEDTTIELVTGKIVDKLLKKGISYYHICYGVENIDRTLENMENVFVISEPKEAILFDYARVAFIMTPLGIIELLELGKKKMSLNVI